MKDVPEQPDPDKVNPWLWAAAEQQSLDEPSRSRPALAIAVVLTLLGLVVGFLRDAFEVFRISPHPVLIGSFTSAAIVAGALVGALEARRKYPCRWYARTSPFYILPVCALLILVGYLLPAPTVAPPLDKMDGRTNIAIVDFASDAEDADAVSANLASLLSTGLADLHLPIGINISRYDRSSEAPLSEPLERDEWVERFVTETDAHVVVGGVVNSLDGEATEASSPSVVESGVSLVAYIRPDAIPDAPELSRWFDAGTFVTLADVAGSRFGRTEEELLADDMARAISDMALFVEATDSLRAGVPDDAERALSELASSSSSTVPKEFIALYQASAAIMSADQLSGSSRAEKLSFAQETIAPFVDRFPRARFLQSEIELQQLLGDGVAGCSADQVTHDAIQRIISSFASVVEADGVEPLTDAKARLGMLKARQCAVIAGLSADRSADISSIRADADSLVRILRALPQPENVAGEPLAARALTLWPELVLHERDTSAAFEAIAELELALAIERRPERRTTVWQEIAVLRAFVCDGEGARAALARAEGMLGLTTQQDRLESQPAEDTASKTAGLVEERLRDRC